MLRVALQGLRGRKGPFVGAFVALALAAALVMACGTLLEAGLRSDPPVERYSGAPLVVGGEQEATVNAGKESEDSVPLVERAAVPSSLVARLSAVPGVRAAVPDVTVPATILTRAGAVDGPTGHPTALHPWPTAALTPYELASGHAPVRADQLVVDAGLARRGSLRTGDRVRLASNGPARTMTVAGVARPRADVTRQGVIFVTAAEAARFVARPGRVDAIGILPAAGVPVADIRSRIEPLLPTRTRVVTGADRGEVEYVETIEAKEAVIAIASTFGGLALFIAMFVVASTIGLSVLQRGREVALLRAIAATPKQVRRMIRWEALVVGLLAAAAGVVPGALFAGALGHALSDRGIAPEDMEVVPGLLPVVAAVGSTVLTALVAVAAAGRRAARVRPTLALQETAAEPRLIGSARLVAGLVTIAGAGGLLAVSAASERPSAVADAAVGVSFAFVVAVALLGPLVVRLAAAVAGPLIARTSRVGGHLAMSNIRTSSRRFASAVTPLVLTVALSATLIVVATTRTHAAARQGDDRVVADLVLGSDGPGVPRGVAAAARDVPGVAAAVSTTGTTLGPGLGATYRGSQAVVVDPERVSSVLDLDVTEGSLARLGDDAIALSETRADEASAEVGDRVGLMLGDGTPRRAHVAAVYRRDLGLGEAVLPTAMAARHLTSPLVDAVLVRTAPGASHRRVATRLRAVAEAYPGVAVGDRHDLAVRVDEDRETNDWLFRILAGIVFAFTAIAVVNTLVMIGLQRTRELGLLRLVGATTRQVHSMALWEAGLLVMLGVGLGGVIALITLMPTSQIISGSPIPYAPPAVLALVLGSSAAVGILGVLVATRLALRPSPVDAIGLRE